LIFGAIVDIEQITNLRDRYFLESEIGSGSVARVFRGYEKEAKQPVAVKVMHRPGRKRQRDAFYHGAEVTEAMSHPNIARTYEVGEAFFDGIKTPYAIMEYVPGRSLQEVLNEKGTLPSEAVVSIGADIASALSHIHSKGIMHRDIRPANILMTPDNLAVLIDFTYESNIGFEIEQQRPIGVSRVQYASPEHLQSEIAVSCASDIYSLGATLYRAAAGHAIFKGTPYKVASKHLSLKPLPLNRQVKVSSRIDGIIMQTLQKEPSTRPQASGLTAVFLYEMLKTHGWLGWYKALKTSR
jgi:serine/threonine-protein kinase